MTTRKSGIFALAIVTAVLAACEGDTIVPTPPVEVEVVPAAIQVDSGSTGTLVAVVRNATNTAVTWASANTAIATVANGVVTGVKPGQVTITATSAESSGAIGAATVTVTRPAGAGGREPIVTIRQITQGNTNVPVVPSNVAGQIDVTVEYELNDAPISALRVFVDNTQVCEQTFSSGNAIEVDATAALTTVCSINTAGLNSTGQPLFANGAHSISARLVSGAGEVRVSSSQNLTFNNVDQLALTVTAPGASANDQGGLVWKTGDIRVQANPAIFSGAAGTVSRVTFAVRNAGTNAVIVSFEDTTAPFDVTFDADSAVAAGGLAGVETSVYVTATSVVAGQPGPMGQSGTNAVPALRLDNAAPAAGTGAFNNPVWFSTVTSLTDTARVTNLNTMVDGGVNRVSVKLQYNNDEDAQNDDAGWTDFTAVTALTETNTTTERAFRALVCDALNNCREVGPVQSGVDHSAPSIRVPTGAPANNAVNPGADLQIIGTDAISGVSTIRVRVTGRSVFEVDNNVDTDVRCYNGIALGTSPADTAFAATNGVCATRDVVTVTGPGATENNAFIDIPDDENWYSLEIITVDVAGNVSATPITRSYLRDTTAPTATISSTTLAGTNATISGRVDDNIQVRAYDSRFRFVGIGDIPFSAATTVDASLDNTLTGRADATASSSLVVRELQNGLAAVAVPATQYGFGAFDLANNFGFNGTAITFGAGDGVDNAATATVAASETDLCRTGTTAACTSAHVNKTSATLTASIVTDVPPVGQVFPNPIARVYYYYIHPGANGTFADADDYFVLIGSTDAAAATVETNAVNGVRTFRFTNSVAASAFPQVGNFPVHAIAVDAQGDAVLVSTNINVR